MKKSTLKQLLLSTTLLGLARRVAYRDSARLSAASPRAPQADDDEVVVITGTRISREGYVSSSPITTIDAEELPLKQPVDVEDRSARHAAVPARQRRPGEQRLVGHLDPRPARPDHAAHAAAHRRQAHGRLRPERPLRRDRRSRSPLLERVDVVTGGASAVYGSDAVAGVVNFILNDDFQGAQLDANYSITDHGDGETENYPGHDRRRLRRRTRQCRAQRRLRQQGSRLPDPRTGSR